MKICMGCGNQYEPDGEYKKRVRQFCSTDCYIKWTKRNEISKICPVCDKPFVVKGKHKDRIYCSDICFKLHRKQNKKPEKEKVILSCAVDNIDYFEKIDMPEKSYILGLLASDGSNDGYKVNFTSCDRDLIDFIAKELGYHNKISETKPRSDKHAIAYSINISNKKMGSDLIKLGLTPRKSFDADLQPPIIDETLLSAFWLGYFDGDGCVYINKGRYVRLSIVSACEPYIDCFIKFLDKNNIAAGKQHYRNIYSATWGGFTNAERWKNLVYTSDIGGIRKRCKLMKFLNDVKPMRNLT